MAGPGETFFFFPLASSQETLYFRGRPLSGMEQVSRSTDLAYEDMGILRDPMDKRMDLLLDILAIDHKQFKTSHGYDMCHQKPGILG